MRSCKRCGAPIVGLRKRFVHCRNCSSKLPGSMHKRHGQSETREYAAWTAMRERCNNPNCYNYPKYGARGIKVCERWNTYENFIADMGPRPPGLSIERIDNDGNYEPGNCKWATKLEQSRNRRNCYTAEQDAQIRDAIARGLNFTQIARLLGKSVGAVSSRAYRMGLHSGAPPIPKKVRASEFASHDGGRP
jgi:hypothetical protein